MQRLLSLLAVLLVAGPAAAQSPILEGLKTKRDQLQAARKERQAIKAALEVIKQAEQGFGPDHNETLLALQRAGQLYQEVGNYLEAERLFALVLERTEKKPGRTNAELAGALTGLGSAHLVARRFAESEALYRRVEKIYLDEYGPTHSIYLSIYGIRAFIYLQRYMFAAAEEVYLTQLRAYRKADPKSQQALGILLSLGLLYQRQGAADKAKTTMLEYVAAHEAIFGKNDLERVPTAVDGAANLLRQWGYVADAEKLEARAETALTQSIAAQRQKNGHPLMILSTQQMLAELQFRRGKIDAAIKGYQDVIAGYEKQPASKAIIPSFMRLMGRMYEKKGDLGGARKIYQKALAHYRKESFELAADDVLMQLVYLDQQGGRYGDAQKTLAEVLQRRETIWGPRAPATLRTHIELGMLELVLNRPDKAFERLRKAYAAERDNLTNITAAGTEEDNRMYLKEREHHLPLAITLHEKYLPKKQPPLELGLQTALVFKGRLLDVSAQSTGVLRSRLSGKEKQLFDQLTAARNELSRLVLRGPGGAPDEFPREVAELEGRVKSLEAKLRQVSSRFRSSETPIEVAAVRKQIPPGATLVEVVTFTILDPKKRGEIAGEYRYGAYAARASGDLAFVDLGPGKVIDEKVRELRVELADGDSTDYERVGKELYLLTMKKLEPHLGGAKKILVAPDGSLNLVPFAALIDERGKFLLESIEFSYLTSGRDLLRHTSTPAPTGKPFIFADPAFDDTSSGKSTPGESRRSYDLRAHTWSKLPGTAEEGTAIAELLPGVTLVKGREATEARVKKVAAPRILHIATHGFFLDADEAEEASEVGPGENPLLRSGLILAGANKLSSGNEDGVLTALEASGLDLSGTQLVVLSACETGVGKVARGEGVYGLRRALVIAGARAQLISLWKVDDQATRDLMTDYYRNITNKKGHSEALRRTQLQMLENDLFKHPYHWAGFIPSGHSGPIQTESAK